MARTRRLGVGYNGPRNTATTVTTASRVPIAVAVAVLGLRLASTSTADLSFGLLAVYALMGRASALRALFLLWLVNLLNPGIAPAAPFAPVGRYLVLGAAAVSVGARWSAGAQHRRLSRVGIATIALSAYLLFHSALFSTFPDVSLMKGVSWVVAMATLLMAWGQLSYVTRLQLEAEAFTGLVLICVVSMPLAFTGIGYLRNDTGFQGVLAHPQTFGVAMAVAAAWGLARLMTEPGPMLRRAAVVVGLVAAVMMSESRTAGFALAGGVVGAPLLVRTLTGKGLAELLPGVATRRFHLAFLLLAAILTVTAPLAAGRLRAFLQKRTESSSMVDAYERSRGAQMRDMWRNIDRDPVVGIGFGVASDPGAMVIVREPVFGLPIGAAIEKGVGPIAVVEELGFAGAMLVFAWAITAFIAAVRGGVSTTAVLCAVFLTNAGEASLFSFGGTGALLMIMVAWAATADERERSVRALRRTAGASLAKTGASR